MLGRHLQPRHVRLKALAFRFGGLGTLNESLRLRLLRLFKFAGLSGKWLNLPQLRAVVGCFLAGLFQFLGCPVGQVRRVLGSGLLGRGVLGLGFSAGF